MGYIGPRSTPTIFGGKIFAMGATGILRCLDGSGHLVWQRDLFADHGFDAAEAEREVAWGRTNSPLIVDDLVVVPLGGVHGSRMVGLVAMDTQTGETRWESDPYQASYASPVLVDLAVFPQILSVNESCLSSHDPATGAVLWEFALARQIQRQSQCVATECHRWRSRPAYQGLWAGGRNDRGPSRRRPVVDGIIVEEHTAMKTKFSNVAVRDGCAYGIDNGVLSCIELAERESPLEERSVRIRASLDGRS